MYSLNADLHARNIAICKLQNSFDSLSVHKTNSRIVYLE